MDFAPRLLMSVEATVSGVSLFRSKAPEWRKQIEFVDEGLAAGWVKPVLWKTYDLAQAEDAHKEIIVNKGTKGQIVLKIE